MAITTKSSKEETYKSRVEQSMKLLIHINKYGALLGNI